MDLATHLFNIFEWKGFLSCFLSCSCVIKLVSSTSALELVDGPAWFVLDCNLKQRQEKLFSNL